MKNRYIIISVSVALSVILFVLSLNIASYTFGWKHKPSSYVYVPLAEEGQPGIDFWQPMKYLFPVMKIRVLKGLPHIIVGGITIADVYKIMKNLESNNIIWLKYGKQLPVTQRDVYLSKQYISHVLVETPLYNHGNLVKVPPTMEEFINKLSLEYPTHILLGDIEALPCSFEKKPTDIALIGPQSEYQKLKQFIPNINIPFHNTHNISTINPLYEQNCPVNTAVLYIPWKYVRDLQTQPNKVFYNTRFLFKDNKNNIERWAIQTGKHWKEYRWLGSPVGVLIGAILSLVLLILSMSLIISIITGIYLLHRSVYQINSKNLLVLYALGNTSWTLIKGEILSVLTGYIVGLIISLILTDLWHITIPTFLSVSVNLNKVNYILNIHPWNSITLLSLTLPIIFIALIHRAMSKQIHISVGGHGYIIINFKLIIMPLLIFSAFSIFTFSILATTLYTGKANTNLYSFDHILTGGYLFMPLSDITTSIQDIPTLSDHVIGGISYDGQTVFLSKSLSYLSPWAKIKFHAPVKVIDNWKNLSGNVEGNIILDSYPTIKISSQSEEHAFVLYVSRRLKKAMDLGNNIKSTILYSKYNIHILATIVILSALLVIYILALSIYSIMVTRGPYRVASLLTCGFTMHEGLMFIIKRYSSSILIAVVIGTILGISLTIGGFIYLGWSYTPWIVIGTIPIIVFLILFILMLYTIPKALQDSDITTILKRDI